VNRRLPEHLLKHNVNTSLETPAKHNCEQTQQSYIDFLPHYISVATQHRKCEHRAIFDVTRHRE